MHKHRFIIGFSPIYKKLYGIPYVPWILRRLSRIFRLWEVSSSALPPRATGVDRDDIDFLIYTDASYEARDDSGGLGSIVIDRFNFTHLNNVGDTIFESIAPESIIGGFRHSSIIFGLELAAVCWAVLSMAERLRGTNLLIFIDNDGVLRCMTRAASRVGEADTFVAALWWLFAFLDVRVWCEGVTSADNAADLPSRGIPFRFFDADRYGGFHVNVNGRLNGIYR